MLSIAGFKVHKVDHPQKVHLKMLILHLKQKDSLSFKKYEPFFSVSFLELVVRGIYTFQAIQLSFIPEGYFFTVVIFSLVGTMVQKLCWFGQQATHICDTKHYPYAALVLLVLQSTRPLQLFASGRFQLPSCWNTSQNMAAWVAEVTPKTAKGCWWRGERREFFFFLD